MKVVFVSLLYFLWLICSLIYMKGRRQGVTKRCRLSCLTNSVLVYEPICGGKGVGIAGVAANKYSCAHGAQINFKDLTPFLSYGRRLPVLPG
jgi:hypothetical protein